MRCPSRKDLPIPPQKKTGWPWTEESLQLPDTMPDSSLWPKISIVTPSYNQGQFIEETIRSVLLQGYPNLEYLIIDGGSTDNSVEIIRKYEPWLHYWISETDEGQSDAINKGFAESSGLILNWLNSDDYYLPDALFTVAKYYSQYSNCGGWFGGCRRIGINGSILYKRWPKGLEYTQLANWKQNWVQQPSCFFSKSGFESVGPLDTSLYIAFDFDFWLKLSRFSKIRKIDEELAVALNHNQAKTVSNKNLMIAETWVVMIKHGFEQIAITEMNKRLKSLTIAENNLSLYGYENINKQLNQAQEQLDRLRDETLFSSSVYRSSNHMETAYKAYQKRDWHTLRRNLWQAAINDPSWIFNRGYLSMIAQTIHLKKRS